MNIEAIRADFPMLAKGNAPIYFDNACTSLKPINVIDAINSYYYTYSGCSGRSMHHIAKKTEERFELARGNIANFVNARQEEVIFTKNTTEAINLVANSIVFQADKKNIVTTIMEHHSAYLPFYELCKRRRIELDTVHDINSLKEWSQKITKETALVVTHAINNTLGTGPDLKEITNLTHQNNALILVDGAQSVPHALTNFKRNDIDFLAFSGHKMLGPTGIGCLVSKTGLMEGLNPFIVGGGTIEEVKSDKVKYLNAPHKFEGGIQNYAGAIGLSAAVDYLKKIGMGYIEAYEKRLTAETEKRASEIDNLIIYGNFEDKKSAIFTFNIKDVEPHQVTIMLDKMKKICTRSGVFCAQPAMEFLGAPNGAVRASLYFYNTFEELDIFFNCLETVAKTLRG